MIRFKVRDIPSVAVIVMVCVFLSFDMDEMMKCHTGNALLYRSRLLLLLIAAFLLPVIPTHDMNGHINETAPPLVPIGEVKLVQVQIVVWFVRTCEVWIPFVLHFCLVQCTVKIFIGGAVRRCSGSFLTLGIVCGCPWIPLF